MSFDLATLAAKVRRNGPVARILVSETRGSVPREAGAAMLVHANGTEGTIGGGTLEFQAVATARDILKQEGRWVRSGCNFPLGPALGQCCGGNVSLLTERFTDFEIAELERSASSRDAFSRPLASGLPALADRPVRLERTLNRSAALGEVQPVTLQDNWISEPLATDRAPVWIFGAGHVGRALVSTLLPLELDLTWVDTAPERFPEDIPDTVTRLVAADPGAAVRFAPTGAHHLVLTYSHALDLEICHRLLSHTFSSAGLIGSATKWARFRKRLAALGHSTAQIERIICPIGIPELGKEPATIAVGVAAELLKLVKGARLSADISKGIAT